MQIDTGACRDVHYLFLLTIFWHNTQNLEKKQNKKYFGNVSTREEFFL